MNEKPTPAQSTSRLADVETELRKMESALSAAGVSSGAIVLRLAADIVASAGRQAVALTAIARCDDLVMRGEDDGPELARRLRFAVSTAENGLLGGIKERDHWKAKADALGPHPVAGVNCDINGNPFNAIGDSRRAGSPNQLDG